MSWQKKQDSKNIKFIELWLFLSQQIGNSRLPIKQKANNINELVTGNDEHISFMTDIIQQTYKKNHCYHLASPINIETVLDSLGETAHQLRDNQQDDLLNIELLEEIAWHIIERYGYTINQQTTGTQKQTASITSLSQYRQHKANIRF